MLYLIRKNDLSSARVRGSPITRLAPSQMTLPMEPSRNSSSRSRKLEVERGSSPSARSNSSALGAVPTNPRSPRSRHSAWLCTSSNIAVFKSGCCSTSPPTTGNGTCAPRAARLRRLKAVAQPHSSRRTAVRSQPLSPSAWDSSACRRRCQRSWKSQYVFLCNCASIPRW